MFQTQRFFLHPLWLTLALAGCASTTVIHSDPPGAAVFINGSLVGFTPYSYTDRRPSFSQVTLRLQKDGYEPYETNLSRDESIEVENVLGACCIVPAFWFMGYDPVHTYVLKPSRELPPADWLEGVESDDPGDD